MGARLRGPAQGRSREWVLPEPDHGGRSPRSLDPEGRGRLLHDVFVVRRLPGSGRLALARPGQLGTDRAHALQERRVDLGAGPREAQGALLHLLPRPEPGVRRAVVELRDLGRQHPRAVERSHRPRDRPHRPRTHRHGRWQALRVRQRRLHVAARRRRPVRDSALEEGLRRLAVSRRVGRRGVRAGGTQDAPPRRLLLHGARRGWNGRTADEPHGRRRALAQHRGAVGELSVQPDHPDDVARRAVVVEGTRHASRGAGRQVVRRLPRLRERLLQPRAADTAGTGGVDDGRLVEGRRHRRRPTDQEAGQRLGDPRFPALGRLLEGQDGRPVELLQGHRPGQGALPLRTRRARAEGQGDDSRRQFAAVVRERRPRVRDRGRSGVRCGRDSRPHPVLQQPPLRGARHLRPARRDAPLRDGASERQARGTRAAGVHPPEERSSHRDDPHERRRQGRGGSSGPRWKCRATTTTWPTIS